MVKTLEDRVTHLEREVAGVKSRIERNEAHVAVVDTDMKNIPDLIKLESRMMDSRFARMHSETDGFRSEMRREMSEFRSEMNQRFDAVIRAVSELVAQ